MEKYKLTYFNGRGLAEPIRLLFALARVPYEDFRISYTEGSGEDHFTPELWAKLPFGQVPLLECDDLILSQSAAIGRYLATKFNLHGKDDLEAARVDEIIDAVKDFWQTFRPLWFAKDEEEKEDARKNIVGVSTPKYMGKFNDILKENGTGFLVGDGVSLADLFVFNTVNALDDMMKVDFDKDYPEVKASFMKVGEIPQIKEWVGSRPVTRY